MKCPDSACKYVTSDDVGDTGSVADHLKMLELHCSYAHAVSTPAATSDASRTARIQQPKVILIDGAVEAEDWEFFLHSWSEYKTLAVPGTRVKEILGNVLGEVAAGVFNRLGKAGYEALTEKELLLQR